MEGFSVKIVDSSKEFSAKERVQIKDVSNAMKIADMIREGTLIISIGYYALLEVHNERSDNVDYRQLVLGDKEGNRYVTGSGSFIEAFLDIYSEMEECSEEWALECLCKPSKNRAGQSFLTCTVV